MNSEKQQQKRIYESHANSLGQTAKSLQDEIELTVYNYQNILQTEKKNSADRSEFLLYLIQSLRMRHNEEIEAINAQMQAAEGERQQAQSMQKQMENIGQGLDQIMEESRRLKAQNEGLQKELDDQEQRERELDDEIDSCKKELDECRLRADEWERTKIKWNRQKKQLLEMIEEAERSGKKRNSAQAELPEEDNTERNKIEELFKKYNGELGGN